jgi:hypothetical protein
MYLTGNVLGPNEVLNVWALCFNTAGWTMVSGGARHPNDNTVGLNWELTRVNNGQSGSTTSFDRVIINPVFPSWPYAMNVAANKTGWVFGPKVHNYNDSVGTGVLVNNFSYPASWTFHWDAAEGEAYWQMNDGFNVDFFCCGIEKRLHKQPGATGFWVWSNGPKPYARCYAGGIWMSYAYNAYPIPDIPLMDDNAAFPWGAIECDIMPGGPGVGNCVQASNTHDICHYGWDRGVESIDARYRVWPVRHFKVYTPTTLNVQHAYLCVEMQTIKNFRSWSLNIGDTFSIGLDEYCWYPIFRRKNGEGLGGWGGAAGDVIGAWGNSHYNNDPNSSNFGVAIKKTT